MDVVEGYVERLREALREARVETEASAVADVREFLTSELSRCRAERPEWDEAHAFEEFVAKFGTPERVAREYVESEPPLEGLLGWYRRMSRYSYAPGWKIHCGRCGRSGDYGRSAPLILRLGSRSRGKWVLGWCSECRRLRFLWLYRA